MLTGGLTTDFFDNPKGLVLYPHLPDPSNAAIFDFGCGCGRLARQLIQQVPQPRRYVGIDLHLGMIGWCQRNLGPHAPGFTFCHHDVYNIGLNPGAPTERITLPFPVGDEEFDLVLAWSVFTHLLEPQIEFYLAETARILKPGGTLKGTFFTFDKTDFAMMQTFQNALYINPVDPTNAVIVDRSWLRDLAASLGLRFTEIAAPRVRGFHWDVTLTKGSGAEEADWPDDALDRGHRPPPLMPANASGLG